MPRMSAWKAWWSLLPNLERVHNVAEILGWVCAIGIAIALPLMWWTGKVLREWAQTQATQLATQLTTTQTALGDTQTELQRTRAELEEARRPRSLTGEQRVRFIATLRHGPASRVDITTVSGDDESYAFGTQIATALREAGWDPHHDLFEIGMGPRGVIVSVHDQNHISNSARVLVNALEQAGVQVLITDRPPPVPGRGPIALIVGRKP